MRKSEKIVLVIITLSFAIGIYFYPSMPDRVASHWNAAGEVDGYMSKLWGTFLMPVMSLGLLVLFIMIPVIDPLKRNIQKFRQYYDGLVVLIIAFLFYLYMLTLYWNLGGRFNMTLVMAPALGALFIYVSVLLKNAKRNWFIGIRTPWTLSSDRVWKKTHKIGSKLFLASGILALLGAVFADLAMYFVLAPVLLSVAYLVVYSYFEYQKEKK